MQNFLAHLSDASPGFRCYSPGLADSELEHEVRVKHKLGAPAGQGDIAELHSQLGHGSEDFEALYSLHNGMVLYSAGKDAGIAFYSIGEFKDRNAEWREWFEDMDEDDLWDFQKHGVAFGEIIASGNYFVFWQGGVYYSSHDDDGGMANGATLSEFLDRIAADPAQFLYDAGCYTRYGPKQWIPGQYVPEMR